MLADPALAGVILVNEGGLQYLARTRGGWPAQLQVPFNDWVHNHYVDQTSLEGAWGGLRTGESWLGKTLDLPTGTRMSSRRQDFLRFLSELERAVAADMGAYLREQGYAGPLSAYDNWGGGQSDASRAGLDWVDMHAYHDEALSFAPDARISQSSSLRNGGAYLRELALSRQAGKPFSVTEYGQPFWNRYRFAAGLMAGTMAALQGWDFVCQHAEGGIDLTMKHPAPRKLALHPYGVGMDPVARAGETLLALLFMRGDVAPARQRWRMEETWDAVFSAASIQARAPIDLGSLAWVSSIERHLGSGAMPLTAGSNTIVPVEVVPSALNSIARVLAQSGMPAMDPAAQWRFSTLQQAGAVSATNKSAPWIGYYQSETEQSLLDARQGKMLVQTARTSALASDYAIGNVNLGALEVVSLDEGALVAASALDGEQLATSGRILLILASDAQNTGMLFTDSKRQQLVALGTLPVQLRRTKAHLKLRLEHDRPMELHALSLAGRPQLVLPVQQRGTEFELSLDSGVTPTTYYLLETR